MYVYAAPRPSNFDALGEEGFDISTRAASPPASGPSPTGSQNLTVLSAATPSGALYGAFRLLSYLQRGLDVPVVPVQSIPQMSLRHVVGAAALSAIHATVALATVCGASGTGLAPCTNASVRQGVVLYIYIHTHTHNNDDLYRVWDLWDDLSGDITRFRPTLP